MTITTPAHPVAPETAAASEPRTTSVHSPGAGEVAGGRSAVGGKRGAPADELKAPADELDAVAGEQSAVAGDGESSRKITVVVARAVKIWASPLRRSGYRGRHRRR